MKKINKYLSAFLILILVNSNFSFATVIMKCSMSDSNKKCECAENVSAKTDSTIDSAESDCCKTVISEVNNSNTLETYKTVEIKSVSIHFIKYSLQDNLYSSLNSASIISQKAIKPASDIPLLKSSLLI
jgi:uncharacterized protein YpmS